MCIPFFIADKGAVSALRTRVKICGITRPEDAIAAAELGADAIGLVFCEASPRAVDRRMAEAIITALPPFVSVVGLFVDPDRQQVEVALEELRLDLLQFHGDEPPEFCAGFHRRYIKAVPMGGGIDPVAYLARYPGASGFLFDGHAVGELGGRGVGFDHGRLPAAGCRYSVLAGGLTPENVGEVVARVRPFAVDVSSGVEARPGIKDRERMAKFMAEVERAGNGGKSAAGHAG